MLQLIAVENSSPQILTGKCYVDFLPKLNYKALKQEAIGREGVSLDLGLCCVLTPVWEGKPNHKQLKYYVNSTYGRMRGLAIRLRQVVCNGMVTRDI